jgi:hypothetical protein
MNAEYGIFVYSTQSGLFSRLHPTRDRRAPRPRQPPRTHSEHAASPSTLAPPRSAPTPTQRDRPLASQYGFRPRGTVQDGGGLCAGGAGEATNRQCSVWMVLPAYE